MTEPMVFIIAIARSLSFGSPAFAGFVRGQPVGEYGIIEPKGQTAALLQRRILRQPMANLVLHFDRFGGHREARGGGAH